jgi:hypothetical protein
VNTHSKPNPVQNTIPPYRTTVPARTGTPYYIGAYRTALIRATTEAGTEAADKRRTTTDALADFEAELQRMRYVFDVAF